MKKNQENKLIVRKLIRKFKLPDSFLGLLPLFLIFLLIFSSCEYSRPDLSSSKMPQRAKDSLKYLYERHYTWNSNFKVIGDSIFLKCLPIENRFITLHKGDRVVVADIAVHPKDSVDSVWVKLAHTQDMQGWVHEKNLIRYFVPTDIISQGIYYFSDTHLPAFIGVCTLFVFFYLIRRFRRSRLQLDDFRAIDLNYLFFLCILISFSATLYESMQVFLPQTWQHFYFNPTLSPFKVPFILSVFLISFWAILVAGLVAIEDLFRHLSPSAAIYYFFGLTTCCIFCYFFFILATQYYVGYFFLIGLIIVFFKKMNRTGIYKYRCGHCGRKLKSKGICPYCGVRNE
ncbi:MAG: hypothetical protein WCR86_09185 [Parabacteroides sp.]